jgi:hypothetical protein
VLKFELRCVLVVMMFTGLGFGWGLLVGGLQYESLLMFSLSLVISVIWWGVGTD